jgi:hypothetical protein
MLFCNINRNALFLGLPDVYAAKATHKRLHDVHAGKVAPISQRPKASAVGTPSSPWDP